MGCECCKIDAPHDYAKCKVANKIPHGRYIAPCGMEFEGPDRNRTPPKKKRKKRR